MLDAELFSRASQLWSLGAGKLTERNWTDRSLGVRLKSCWLKIDHLSKLWAKTERKSEKSPGESSHSGPGKDLQVLGNLATSVEKWAKTHADKNHLLCIQSCMTCHMVQQIAEGSWMTLHMLQQSCEEAPEARLLSDPMEGKWMHMERKMWWQNHT